MPPALIPILLRLKHLETTIDEYRVIYAEVLEDARRLQRENDRLVREHSQVTSFFSHQLEQQALQVAQLHGDVANAMQRIEDMGTAAIHREHELRAAAAEAEAEMHARVAELQAELDAVNEFRLERLEVQQKMQRLRAAEEEASVAKEAAVGELQIQV